MLGMQLNSIVYWLIWSTKIIPVESKINLHCLGLGWWSQLAVLQDGMQRMNHRSKVIMEVNPRHSNCWKGWQEDAFVNGASFEDSNRTVELYSIFNWRWPIKRMMMRKLAWFITYSLVWKLRITREGTDKEAAGHEREIVFRHARDTANLVFKLVALEPLPTFTQCIWLASLFCSR